MKRILAALLLLFAVDTFAAGPGEYLTTTAGQQSYGNTTTGSRRNIHIYLSSTGDITAGWDKNSGASGILLGLWQNYGASFAEATPWAINVQPEFGIYGKADSAYVIPAWVDSTSRIDSSVTTNGFRITIRKYVDGSSASPAADTLDLTGPRSSGGGSRPGLAWDGSTFLELRNYEAATDASQIWETDAGYGSITTSTSRGTATLLNAGFRLPVYVANVGSGILIHDVTGATGAGSDIRFACDEGISLVASNVTGGLDFTVSGRDGYAMTGIAAYGDSNIVIGWQSPTNGQNQLNVRAGHLSSGATGAPSSVSWHASAHTVLASGAVRDSFATSISFSYLRRDPDSIWGFYRIAAVGGDYAICRIFTGDGGANWSAPDTIRTDTTSGNTWRFYGLQAAPYANVDDTCIWFALQYTDSLVSTSEYGKIFIDTIRLTTAPPEEPSPSKRRRTGIPRMGAIDPGSGHYFADAIQYNHRCLAARYFRCREEF